MNVRVAIRELRNDTRAVIDAVERGEDVVLTRRGRPVARILPVETDEADLEAWLDEVTADPVDSGLMAEVAAGRRADDRADDRRPRIG